jgi:hypothetical protein
MIKWAVTFVYDEVCCEIYLWSSVLWNIHYSFWLHYFPFLAKQLNTEILVNETCFIRVGCLVFHGKGKNTDVGIWEKGAEENI